MRTCDVVVVGLGLIGSAALDALMQRGVDVVGLDPLDPGSDRGSSHGSCRVFRRFNFENANYTELGDEAWAGWGRLAEASGAELLIPTPVLEAGPAGSPMVAASRGAAFGRGIDVPLLTGAEVNARFPAFNLPLDWEAVVQDGGAILLAEAALSALRARAQSAGRIERVSAVELVEHADHVVVRTSAGERIRARCAILATGPWLGRLAPRVGALLEVTRQVVGWFQPARPESALSGVFPIFILADGDGGAIYGFPDFEGRGVKAASHDHGPAAEADAWGPPPSDAELQTVADILAERIPGASGRITERDVCLYTNARPADRRSDAGDEFIIDRMPGGALIVASACSGHGAKFAPAIGERLARLATDPAYRCEPYFRLSRYRAFPDDEERLPAPA